MNVHITLPGVLMVIGGVAVAVFVGYMLLVLWVMFRWGK